MEGVTHSGGCLCGAVRFAATGPLREVVFCHCGQCRRQSGLFVAATAVDQGCLAVTGQDRLRWYAASAHAKRGFCRDCGTLMFWRPEAGQHVAIMAGSLDDPSVLRPGYHICTDGRPAFYDLSDGLPQYPHSAPGLTVAPTA
jgi:hypothetical protein